MKPPLVSIIMPAYNAEKYISESIMSVIDQSYDHWELMIIDDGSKDATADKIQVLVAKDDRIKYIFQENGGQGKARNRGLLEAKGYYIAFLDADDLWVKEKLSTQVKALQHDQDIALLFSSALAFKGTVEHTLRPLNPNNSSTYYGFDAVREFLRGNKIPILTVLVKREVVEAVGNFDGSLHLQNVEDSHLWLKMLFGNYKLKSSAEILAYYRIHEEQVTSNKFKNTLKEINLIKDFLGRDAAIDKDIFTEISKKYYSLFIREKTPTEKEILYDHYSKNFRIQDTFLLKNMMDKMPLRGFSIYYRYIHRKLSTQQNMI